MDKEKAKEIKRTIGRLETKGPRVINPKKAYRRKQKYQENFLEEVSEQDQS